MSYLTIKKEVEKGKIAPVYFMYGLQSFLMEDIIQAIIRQQVGSSDDPNVITYNVQETLIDLVIEEAETVPFFGGNKVVIAKDCLFVTSAKQDTKLDHNLKVLEQYLENPVPETVLIICAPYEKLDERKKLTKRLKKQTVVDCSPFDLKMTEQWLEEQVKAKGVSFVGQAKERLVERVGIQLLQLSSEIEKLTLYVGEQGEITEGVVDLLVARSLEQDVFALIEYAVTRRVDRALIIYHDLLKLKEEPLKILALIARQIRIYYQVKEMLKKSFSQGEIASQLKLHPYVVKLASKQIRRFTEGFLLQMLEAIADVDYAIKTGKMDKVLAVELLLMKFSEDG
ncbi:DNA polymerase III subunit delta [Alkalihalobacillus hemicellulosilyticus]|uniref:DNA polymerase III subunit delta n=1 Tax=Halalkalibacter hemicellulosilyticus TaxID=127886 RepID=UPI00055298EB|nr:DNA polymerase III subunit delta [Halalkalibacter hemicellulosilyticus]